MDPVTARFGRRVRQLRLARGLTQEELGKAAGLDPKHVGVIERGVKSSSFDAVSRLAKALHVDVHELFLPDGQQVPLATSSRPSAPGAFRKVPRGKLEAFLQDLAARLQRMQR